MDKVRSIEREVLCGGHLIKLTITLVTPAGIKRVFRRYVKA